VAKTSNVVVRDAEIALEQEHVDRVYTRVEELRGEARDMRDKGFALADGAKNEADFEQGQMLLARDIMVRHASRMLASLDSEHEGLVFGRLDDNVGETQYIGRLGVRDSDFTNLVTDWRAPAAAAFYQATAEEPMGVVRRRVIRCSAERVVDIDDDLLSADELPEGMRVVGEGALLASLSRARDDKMRDIVATIQAEQDRAIRAPWRGVTEITGGPGTGKTAVALHRAAYLLYRDRRRMGGGVLVVGPSPVFTNYISRVLPSMGEDTVELRALGEVPDGVAATRLDPARTASVKGSLRMRRLLRRAVRGAPAGVPSEMRIVYAGEVLTLNARELGAVRRNVLGRGGLPNSSRVIAAEALLDALWRKAESYESLNDGGAMSKRSMLIDDLAERIDFHRFVVAWWPERSPAEVLTSLGDRSVLADAAGRAFSAEEVALLASSWRYASDGGGWSVADAALLDELRVQLGQPPKRRRRAMLDEVGRNYDEYAHIVVDESQDLSPMQWRMIGRRGAYASWTVVGDPVQSSWPDPAEAAEAAERAYGRDATRRRFTLRTNYRNSAEIFALAADVVSGVATPEELPEAVRSTGEPPTVTAVSDMPASARAAVTELLGAVDGTIGVITAMDRVSSAYDWLSDVDDPGARIRVVGSLDAKGMEYDAVVLVEPAELLDESTTGPRGLYVALTRATQRLHVLTTDVGWAAAHARG
jgi:DNA helicase IV